MEDNFIIGLCLFLFLFAPVKSKPSLLTYGLISSTPYSPYFLSKLGSPHIEAHMREGLSQEERRIVENDKLVHISSETELIHHLTYTYASPVLCTIQANLDPDLISRKRIVDIKKVR